MGEENEALLVDPEAAMFLSEIGVDVVGLVDYVDVFFKDHNTIPYSEFMELILQLRGTNQATVKDLIDLRKIMVSEIRNLESKLSVLMADKYGSFPLIKSAPPFPGHDVEDPPHTLGCSCSPNPVRVHNCQ